MAGRVARVLLDTPLPQLDHLFDYLIPEAIASNVEPGRLVSVPLRGGKRMCNAYVVEVESESSFTGQLQAIDKVISGLPILGSQSIDLARAVADRQAGSAIDVLRLIVPPRYVRAEKAFIAGLAQGDGSSEPRPSAPPGSRPAAYSNWALHAGGRYVVSAEPTVVEVDQGRWVPSWAVLFAALAAEKLSAGESSILLTPDFRDIESLVLALEAAGLSDFILRSDTQQSGQDRFRNYLRSLQDEPVIVVGNRSAALAPVPELGLIAVWDDGDPLYAEPLAPYAHTRDVALVRQRDSEAVLVLASHAMSTDAARLVAVGYADHVIPAEVMRPNISATDLLRDQDSAPARIPSRGWLGAKEALAQGPVLVQVASPGFAPALACAACRERARCRECAGPLAFAHRSSDPACRWCGRIAAAWTCASCGSPQIKAIASGAERTADEIGRAFPGTRIIVADGEHIHTSVPNEAVVVIATPGAEPVAVGGYAAILLLDGERLRSRENLRVNEDVVRTWSNTAALARLGAPVFIAGSGEYLGRVMENWAQADFALEELRDRQALRLPPAVRLATVCGPVSEVRAALESVSGIDSIQVRGPVTGAEGMSRAFVTCDYRASDQLAKTLRAEVIQAATRSRRVSTRENAAARVLRLKIRFDDPAIDSL
jgi:primosomal protein N' (replication factor Y)